MRRSAALVGSIAIHVAFGVLLVVVRSRDVAIERRTTPALEIVQANHPMLVEVVELAPQANAGGGGSRGAPNAGAPSHASTTVRLASRSSTRTNPRNTAVWRDSSTENRLVRDAREATRAVSDALGGLAIESRDSGGEGGDGGGQGGGHGVGRGRGVGLGDGRVVTEQPSVTTPIAPKASKARPAKLIYPKREGDVEEGKLFVARVTVDAEGFVVGANLLQGDGPYAGQAGGLIFRFRYLPALDDDGRPIRSTFDQQFLVQP